MFAIYCSVRATRLHFVWPRCTLRSVVAAVHWWNIFTAGTFTSRSQADLRLWTGRGRHRFRIWFLLHSPTATWRLWCDMVSIIHRHRNWTDRLRRLKQWLCNVCMCMYSSDWWLLLSLVSTFATATVRKNASYASDTLYIHRSIYSAITKLQPLTYIIAVYCWVNNQ